MVKEGVKMNTQRSSNYTSHRKWFEDVITEDIVLCKTSALECLGRFQGWLDEGIIDAYSETQGKYDNIRYHIVENLNYIDTQTIGKVRCTTFDQTINDMLSDIESEDAQPLIEALADYYFENNESFDGLNIKEYLIPEFNQISIYAVEYYDD